MFKAKFSAGHLGRSVSEEVGSAQKVEISEKRLTHIKEKNITRNLDSDLDFISQSNKVMRIFQKADGTFDLLTIIK